MNNRSQAFYLIQPAADMPCLPILVCSPHSGSYYPADLLAASRLGETALRRSEDAYVDQLTRMAPAFGMTSLNARYARAYVDVNRAIDEIDPLLFDGPAFPLQSSERITAGLGVLPRVVGAGLPIYHRKLTQAESDARLAAVYTPWHTALQHEMQQIHRRFGMAVLLDWHSMPSDLPFNRGRRRTSQIVLGDRWGKSCDPVLTSTVAAALTGQGLVVGFNEPYAGGYSTETYGCPQRGYHALQIEIDRSLYMDEEKILPNDNFTRLQAKITAVIKTIGESLPFTQLAVTPLPQAAE